MRKLLIAGCLSCLLVLSLASCGRNDEKAESNIAYGQVIKTDENTITIESGKYKHDGEFKASGEEVSYNLPENVFFDDFKKGDIVAVLFDGNDAVAVTGVDGVSGESETKSKSADRPDSLVTADDEEKEIYDRDYSVSENNKSAVLALNGEGKLDIERVQVNTEGPLSVGIYAVAGGTANCSQVSVETSGTESAALGAVDSSSVIDFSDGSLRTWGADSPCVLSEGKVSLSNATGVSEEGAALLMREKGIINLKNSSVTSESEPAVEISGEQSGSKVSGTCKLMADNSSLKAGSNSSLIRVSGAEASVRIIGSKTVSDSNILAEVLSDESGRGGKLLLYGVGQTLEGDITCDEKSKVKVVLTEESSFIGTLNNAGRARYSKIYLSEDSTWILKGDSYAGSITNEDESCENIDSKGYNIYYDKTSIANKWLDGKTIELKGGGKLMPEDEKNAG